VCKNEFIFKEREGGLDVKFGKNCTVMLMQGGKVMAVGRSKEKHFMNAEGNQSKMRN